MEIHLFGTVFYYNSTKVSQPHWYSIHMSDITASYFQILIGTDPSSPCI